MNESAWVAIGYAALLLVYGLAMFKLGQGTTIRIRRKNDADHF